MRIDPLIKRESLEPLLHNLDQAVGDLEILRTDDDRDFEGEMPISKLRRGGRRRAPDDSLGLVTLTEVDGVLQWEEGVGRVNLAGRRLRRGHPAEAPSGEIVAQFKFEKLPPSEVGGFLESLDKKMTPDTGLRRLDAQGRLQPSPPPAPSRAHKQRALLLVHGTFSNNDNLIEQLESRPEGRDFIARALKDYDDIFAFDHPTLSVSPVLNALDLARLFAAYDGAIDIVCHSRGGLVVRWWLEGFAGAAGGKRRAVLVGSPLAGTSLAAPPRLRAAIGLITNVGRALSLAGGAASLAVPMLSAAVGLVKVVTSVAGFAEKSPLVDAAVAMIPGLAAQSRVGNNAELARLRKKAGLPRPDYFAVRSNFEAEDVGWAFWKRFRKGNLADFGADMVFEGENDLVVDTQSMTELFEEEVIEKERVLDFQTSSRVHHTNYFQQPETIEFISTCLSHP